MAKQMRSKEIRDDLGVGFGTSIVPYREPGTGGRGQKTVNGIVYQRASVWIVNANGVRLRKDFYSKTKRELERKVAKALETPARTAEVSKMTIEAYFVDRFLPGVASTVRPATLASYKNAVDTRIVPMIGKAKFATLRPDNVRAWIGEMKKNGKGDRSDQIAVAILKRGYKRAVDDGLITVSMVANVTAPKVETREKYIPNRKETIHFLRSIRASVEESDYFPLAYCAVSLGMRESELFGLTWDKIDFKAKTVNVFEQCGPLADGTLGQVPCKTGPSKRTLSLDSLTIRALKLQRGKNARLVFPSRTGGYILKRTMAALWFPRLPEAGGLPNDGRIWFHLLRGTAASLLSSDDVSSPKIDKWLGHVTPGIAGRYITIHDADLVKVASVMQRILQPVWSNAGGKDVVN
jgi:integrase